MPIKKTIYRAKFAIKALIFSSLICLVPFVLSLVVNPMNLPYLAFSIVLLVVNAGLNMYFTFFGRKNKKIFQISVIALLSITAILTLLGILLNDQSDGFLIHIAWGVAGLVFIYFLTEAYPGPSIYARIYGPAIIVAISALLYLLLLFDSYAPRHLILQTRLIYGAVLIGIAEILNIIYFIIILKRKEIYADLGEAKLMYDVSTSDESELISRTVSSTNFKNIPRLYEGNVYAMSADCASDVANAINRYLNDCVDTINDMLDFAKGAIRNVDEYNAFVDDYNRWIKNLNNDRKQMADFLIGMSKDRWLDVDDGYEIEYDFCNLTINRRSRDDKSSFRVYISGFSRTYSHSNGVFSGGTLKRTMSFDGPRVTIVNLGYHDAQEDSQASEHGYHLPGTPMPEED